MATETANEQDSSSEPRMEQQKIADEPSQTTLEQRTNCQLDGVDETWVVDEQSEAAELKQAISDVRDDHDEERVIESGVWQLKVYWNENTDSVWVGTYGYNGGYEVEE